MCPSSPGEMNPGRQIQVITTRPTGQGKGNTNFEFSHHGYRDVQHVDQLRGLVAEILRQVHQLLVQLQVIFC